jgi:Ala-tRNA(Pro) deacylase
MTVLDRCIRFMESHGVCYSHSIHAPARVTKEGDDRDCIPPHGLTKSVVYMGDDGYGLAVVPADRVVDLPKLREMLGLMSLRIASETELELLLPGSERGALPPFGSLFGVPVFLDAELAAQDSIAFRAGTSRDVIRISVVDFLRVVHPVVGNFVIGNRRSHIALASR